MKQAESPAGVEGGPCFKTIPTNSGRGFRCQAKATDRGSVTVAAAKLGRVVTATVSVAEWPRTKAERCALLEGRAVGGDFFSHDEVQNEGVQHVCELLASLSLMSDEELFGGVTSAREAAAASRAPARTAGSLFGSLNRLAEGIPLSELPARSDEELALALPDEWRISDFRGVSAFTDGTLYLLGEVPEEGSITGATNVEPVMFLASSGAQEPVVPAAYFQTSGAKILDVVVFSDESCVERCYYELVTRRYPGAEFTSSAGGKFVNVRSGGARVGALRKERITPPGRAREIAALARGAGSRQSEVRAA